MGEQRFVSPFTTNHPKYQGGSMKLKIIAGGLFLLGYALYGHFSAPVGADFMRAVEAGDVAKVHRALEKKVDANTHDQNNYSALYFAAYRGDIAIAEDLLKHGANVNAKSLGGYTPLFGAAMGGHIALVTLLLAHGAEINVVSDEGHTPLYYARDPEVIKVLFTHGANKSSYLKVKYELA
jgi:ankyrin repeat protein